MYEVIVSFRDGVNGEKYYRGDVYPHDGVTATKKRITYLLSSKTKLGEPVIAEVEETQPNEPPEVEETQPEDGENAES